MFTRSASLKYLFLEMAVERHISHSPRFKWANKLFPELLRSLFHLNLITLKFGIFLTYLTSGYSLTKNNSCSVVPNPISTCGTCIRGILQRATGIDHQLVDVIIIYANPDSFKNIGFIWRIPCVRSKKLQIDLTLSFLTRF